jgi:hypothetical protein
MMTAFVVTIGLLVVMSSFVAIAKSQRYSEQMDLANALLRMEMERVRNMDYDDVASEEGDYYTDYAEFPSYRKSIYVAEDGNIKRIEVKIYFEDDRRRAQAQTIIAEL